MKEYETPSVKLYFFDDNYDVLTASIGTSNDNDYTDRDDWFSN